MGVGPLARAFDHTTNSYKFLWFKSILDVIEDKTAAKGRVDSRDLYKRFIINAWYPRRTFKLSFGRVDQVAQLVDELAKLISASPGMSQQLGMADLGIDIASIDRVLSQNQGIAEAIYGTLNRYVQFRFLRPWLDSEIRGINDSQVNRRIRDFADQDSEKPVWNQLLPYHFDNQNIIFNEVFCQYVIRNWALVRDWWKWNFCNYLASANPFVPGVHSKLERPMEQYDIDHFIPWSWLAHDLLWNLVPVSPSANRSKSNLLPNIDQYLEPFISMQISGIEAYCGRRGVHLLKHDFDRVSAGFALSSTENVLEVAQRDNESAKGLIRKTIRENHQRAAQQGFAIWAFRKPA